MRGTVQSARKIMELNCQASSREANSWRARPRATAQSPNQAMLQVLSEQGQGSTHAPRGLRKADCIADLDSSGPEDFHVSGPQAVGAPSVSVPSFVDGLRPMSLWLSDQSLLSLSPVDPNVPRTSPQQGSKTHSMHRRKVTPPSLRSSQASVRRG